MTLININLGCGLVFVDSPEWINLDYSSSSPAVRKANLLGRLPLEDASASLVYSSHFLEHVAGTRSGRVHRSATPNFQQQRNSRLSLSSARYRSRWEPEKGCRIDVRRSAQAHLKTAAVVLSQGGRND